MNPRKRSCIILLLLLWCTACAAGPTGSATAQRSPLPTATITSIEGCHYVPTASAIGGFEIHGTIAPPGSLYGLLMPDEPFPLHPHEGIKIVWRMTGTGTVTVTTNGPDNAQSPLTFGPEFHGSSNYNRPGDEWGTGFNFPSVGCWTVHLRRTDTSGEAQLIIQA